MDVSACIFPVRASEPAAPANAVLCASMSRRVLPAQRIDAAFTGMPGARSRACPVATFTEYTSPPTKPKSLMTPPMRAMLRPSGDHCGSSIWYALEEIARRAEACNQTIVMTEAHVIQKWPGNASRQSNKVRQRQRETKDEVKEATLSGMAIKDLITPVGSDYRLLQRRLFVVLGLFDQSRR